MESTPENPAPRSEASDAAEYWHISKKKVGRLARLLVYVVLPLLVLAILLTPNDFYTDRNKVAVVVAELASAKKAITAQLTENPQADIGADIADLIPAKLFTGDQIDYKAVFRDGTIIAVSHQLGAVVVLRPQIEVDEIKWSCRVNSIHGKRAIPGTCREPSGE